MPMQLKTPGLMGKGGHYYGNGHRTLESLHRKIRAGIQSALEREQMTREDGKVGHRWHNFGVINLAEIQSFLEDRDTTMPGETKPGKKGKGSIKGRVPGPARDHKAERIERKTRWQTRMNGDVAQSIHA